MAGKLDELAGKLPDLGLKSVVPEPVAPWLQAYSGQPGLFAGDIAALLLSAGLNPLAAFPYYLVYFGAAKPLNAYSDDATADYDKLVQVLLPAWAAGTAGGFLLTLPFSDFSPFLILGAIGKALSTGVCLGGVRALQVYEKTGKLPELSFGGFDLDSALDGGAKGFESKFGSPDDLKKPPE